MFDVNDAALRLHKRIWRQGMSWSNVKGGKLKDFGREYYSKLDKLRLQYQQQQKP